MMSFNYSETVQMGAADTWHAMRDFSAIARAGLAERVEMVGDGVGSSRHLHMPGGAVLVERLEARDEAAFTLTYAMTERGPMPLTHYQATLTVSGDEHSSVVAFNASYEPLGVSEEKANRMLGNVYRALIATARTDLGLA
jgi:hypothetical protein